MPEPVPNREVGASRPGMNSRALWLALLCSFAVYLLPIVGPHAAFFLGGSIAIQFRPPIKNLAWAMTNLGVGLMLQAVAFALFYWFWRKRSPFRLLVLLAATVVAAVLVQYLFMLVIPARFLVDREIAKELVTWPEVCSATDAQLATFRTPARQPKDGWTDAWVSDTQGRYSILRLPNCEKRLVPLPQPTVQPGGRVDFSIGITQIVPGGRALVQRQDPATGKITWLLLDADGSLKPLPTPVTTKYVAPFLSTDGTHTAWILQTPESQPPVTYQVHLLPTAGSAPPKVVDLAERASYDLLDVAGRSGELLLLMRPAGAQRLLSIGGQAPALPTGVDPQATTLLFSEQGTVAWDAYKDEGNYVIAWTLTTGSGSYTLPKGRSVTAVAIDPDGRYLAVSVSRTVSVGDVRDAVFVLRTLDSQEVFRRFLPNYNRSGVVFLGREYFAYSELGTTHVLRVPD